MSQKPISISLILNSLNFGGAEKHTLQLFNKFDNLGFKTSLAYLKREEHLLPEIKTKNGKVWSADFGKGWDFSGLIRLASWVKNSKPDILICINSYSLFYGHLARFLSGHRCKIIVIYHSTELTDRDDFMMRLLYRHFFNHSDRIVYVSNAQRDTWESRGLRKALSTVIHNGVDSEIFRDCFTYKEKTTLREQYGFTSEDFIVGICAALRPEKKHEDLIESIAHLKAMGIPVKCLIIGDGPRRQAIEESICRLNLSGDVAITGFLADVRSQIAICDCMAIVSNKETFSIAALESMAMGKPMVMSAIGGATEQVKNGENGYLFPTGDVSALTAVLHRLADRQHCAELGEQARSIVVQNFGIHRMIEKYQQLFSGKS